VTTEYSYHYNTMTPSGESCAVHREADDALVAGGLHHLHAVELVEVLDRAPTPRPLCIACDRPAVRYLRPRRQRPSPPRLGPLRRARPPGARPVALVRGPGHARRLRTADADGDGDAHRY